MKEDIKLMKGNEAIAHAAIRYGADGYFGYPITVGSHGNTHGRKTVGNDRNGSTTSRKRSRSYQYGVWWS